MLVLLIALSAPIGAEAKSTAVPPGASPAVQIAKANASKDDAAGVGDDDAGRAIGKPTRWRVDDVITTTTTTKTVVTMAKLEWDGRTVPLVDVEDAIEASWMEKCTDVDRNGQRLGYLVYVSAWSRQRGGVRDKSIEGALLAVKGSGSDRTWSLLKRSDEPSPEAKRWLDEHFGARAISDEQWRRVMLPAKDVGVGESWNPSPDQVAELFKAGSVRVDPSRVAASGTLEALDDHRARCRLKMTLGLRTVPDTMVPWTKGGTFELVGELTIPLGVRMRVPSTIETRVTLGGDTVENGVERRYASTIEERRTSTPDGTFPELDVPPSPSPKPSPK